jgi:hypothetical protein
MRLLFEDSIFDEALPLQNHPDAVAADLAKVHHIVYGVPS